MSLKENTTTINDVELVMIKTYNSNEPKITFELYSKQAELKYTFEGHDLYKYINFSNISVDFYFIELTILDEANDVKQGIALTPKQGKQLQFYAFENGINLTDQK